MDAQFAAKLCVLGLLIFNTITDLRSRKILILPPLALSCAGVARALLTDGTGAGTWYALWMGALPGLAMLGMSFLWKEEIGAGDGLTLLPAGLWMGMIPALELLFAGLFFAAVYCLVLLILRKAGKKTQIPFMPFLLAGQVFLMMA